MLRLKSLKPHLDSEEFWENGNLLWLLFLTFNVNISEDISKEQVELYCNHLLRINRAAIISHNVSLQGLQSEFNYKNPAKLFNKI